MMDRLPSEFVLKKSFVVVVVVVVVVFMLLPFAKLGIENLLSRYLENYHSFKFGQLMYRLTGELFLRLFYFF